MQLRVNYGIILALGVVAMSTGCSSELPPAVRPAVREIVVEKPTYEKAPGVVDGTWEEPMVDQIHVPPGLDPEGHYYRPSHEEIVEIRQGRWKYRRFPDEGTVKESAGNQ